MLSGSAWAGRRDRAFASAEHPQQRRLPELTDDGTRRLTDWEVKRARRRAEFAARIPVMAAEVAAEVKEEVAAEVKAAVAAELNAAVAAVLDAAFARQREAILDAVTAMDRARVSSATTPTSSPSDMQAPAVALACTSSSVQTALAAPTTCSTQCPSSVVTVSVSALAPASTSVSSSITIGIVPECCEPESAVATSTPISTMDVSCARAPAVVEPNLFTALPTTSSMLTQSTLDIMDSSGSAALVTMSAQLDTPEGADTAVADEDEQLLAGASLERPLVLVTAMDVADDHSFVASRSAMLPPLATPGVDDGQVGNKHKVILPLELLVNLSESKEPGMCYDLGCASATTHLISLLPWDPGVKTGVSRDYILRRDSVCSACVKKLDAVSSVSSDHHQMPCYAKTQKEFTEKFPTLTSLKVLPLWGDFSCSLSSVNVNYLCITRVMRYLNDKDFIAMECWSAGPREHQSYAVYFLKDGNMWKCSGNARCLFVVMLMKLALWQNGGVGYHMLSPWDPGGFYSCPWTCPWRMVLVNYKGRLEGKQSMEEWSSLQAMVDTRSFSCEDLANGIPGTCLLYMLSFLARELFSTQPRDYVLMLQPRPPWAPPVNVFSSISSKYFYPAVHWMVPIWIGTSMRTDDNQFKCGCRAQCLFIEFLVEAMRNQNYLVDRLMVIHKLMANVDLLSRVQAVQLLLKQVTSSEQGYTLSEFFTSLASVVLLSGELLLSWDPGGGKFFGFFTQAETKGRRNATTPAYYRGHCLDHTYFFNKVCADHDCYLDVFRDQVHIGHNYYIGVFLEQLRAICYHNLIKVCLDYNTYCDLSEVLKHEVPWDPGSSTRHRLEVKPKIKEGRMLATFPAIMRATGPRAAFTGPWAVFIGLGLLEATRPATYTRELATGNSARNGTASASPLLVSLFLLSCSSPL